MQTLNYLEKYLKDGYKLSLYINMVKLELNQDIIEFYNNQLLSNYNNIYNNVIESNNFVSIDYDSIDNSYRLKIDNKLVKSNNIDEGLFNLNEMLENKNLTLTK